MDEDFDFESDSMIFADGYRPERDDDDEGVDEIGQPLEYESDQELLEGVKAEQEDTLQPDSAIELRDPVFI